MAAPFALLQHHQALIVIVVICIAFSSSAPPGKSDLWTDSSSMDFEDEDEGNPIVWQNNNDAFDLDGDDVSLNRSPETSRKRWIDDDDGLTSLLQDVEDDNDEDDDDNQIDDGDESIDSDEDDGQEEEEFVIEGVDAADGGTNQKPEATKDMMDDTLKLRHGRHSRHDENDEEEDGDDSDNEDFDDVGNLQDMDEWPSEEQVAPLGTFNVVSYQNKDDDDGIDQNDDDDDEDNYDKSEDDDDDESNDAFSDEDEKDQKIFEDRVLMF